MVLTYNTYCNLLSAIDEYTNMQYGRNQISNIIFKHYVTKYKSFIAENNKRYKKLFRIPLHGRVFKVMNDFRKYMRGK